MKIKAINSLLTPLHLHKCRLLCTTLLKSLMTMAIIMVAVDAAIAKEELFSDTFSEDDSSNYDLRGGQWSYSAENSGFDMAKLLETDNEAMWALREDKTLPRAFNFEADFTADGNKTSVALALKDPNTNDHVLATLSLESDEGEGWWVTAWIIYSYPDEPWGYLQQSKVHIPKLTDSTFILRLRRDPGSNTLEFVVANSTFGTLETYLAPDTVGEEGKQLSAAWPETLDQLSQVGLYGYDSGGTWSRIKLTDLTK